MPPTVHPYWRLDTGKARELDNRMHERATCRSTVDRQRRALSDDIDRLDEAEKKVIQAATDLLGTGVTFIYEGERYQIEDGELYHVTGNE